MQLTKNALITGLGLLLSAASLLHAEAPAPELPKIPDHTFSIKKYGAVGDGKILNTQAFEKTIAAATKAGGGTVEVPEGNFLTAPFELASSINLHLDKGAVILIDDDMDLYPQANGRYKDAITANNAHDVEITGEGTLDGQGAAWWAAFEANQQMTHRPYFIKLTNCTRVLVKGVHITNSPMFHLVPQNCTDVTITSITIKSPVTAHNTDGIDPSGWNFLISDCTIDAGDDNIAIKPTNGRKPGNKNFLVKNCNFLHGHGMSVGSGSSGGIEDLIVTDCTFSQTDAGIRIKTSRGHGGILNNVTYKNLTMDRVKYAIYIIDWYPERNAPLDPASEKPEPMTDLTPVNKNITITNVKSTGGLNAGVIRGLPEAPVTGVTLTNVDISAVNGMKIYHAKRIKFVDSKVTTTKGKVLTSYNAEVTGLE